MLARALAEVVAVAPPPASPWRRTEAARLLRFVDGLPAAMKPSFLSLDLEAGGPTEINAVAQAEAVASSSAAVSPASDPGADVATAALGIAPPAADPAG